METEQEILDASNQAGMLMLERMGSGAHMDAFMYNGYISIWSFTPEELTVMCGALLKSDNALAAPIWIQMNDMLTRLDQPEV